MATTNMSLEQSGYEDQLDRALSLGDLIVYGTIFMLPIAPFSVFGLVWQDARRMVVLFQCAAARSLGEHSSPLASLRRLRP